MAAMTKHTIFEMVHMRGDSIAKQGIDNRNDPEGPSTSVNHGITVKLGTTGSLQNAPDYAQRGHELAHQYAKTKAYFQREL